MLKRIGVCTVAFLLAISMAVWAAGVKEGGTSAPKMMKIASTGGTKSLRGDALKYFEGLVERNSGGKIDVALFLDSQLGSDEDNTMQLETGAIQGALNGTMPHFTFFPEMRIEYYPFVYDNSDHLIKFYHSATVKAMDDRLIKEHKIRPVSIAVRGPRHITSNRPVYKPEDIKGLKFRAPGMDIVVNAWKKLGADTIAMPLTELFGAMQQKMVDGQENPIDNIYSWGLYEVQEYISLTYHTYSARILYVNEPFWQSLDSNLQKIVKNAGDEMAVMIQNKIKEDDEKKLAEMKSKGLKVIEADVGAFKNAFVEMIKTFPELDQKMFNLIQDIK